MHAFFLKETITCFTGNVGINSSQGIFGFLTRCLQQNKKNETLVQHTILLIYGKGPLYLGQGRGVKMPCPACSTRSYVFQDKLELLFTCPGMSIKNVNVILFIQTYQTSGLFRPKIIFLFLNQNLCYASVTFAF